MIYRSRLEKFDAFCTAADKDPENIALEYCFEHENPEQWVKITNFSSIMVISDSKIIIRDMIPPKGTLIRYWYGDDKPEHPYYGYSNGETNERGKLLCFGGHEWNQDCIPAYNWEVVK